MEHGWCSVARWKMEHVACCASQDNDTSAIVATSEDSFTLPCGTGPVAVAAVVPHGQASVSWPAGARSTENAGASRANSCSNSYSSTSVLLQPLEPGAKRA
jgi:hypothetical protein